MARSQVGFLQGADSDEQLKNLSLPQIKQIIQYVRAMEQSSFDLSEQMQGILTQIETLEQENENLTKIASEKDELIKAYEKTNKSISQQCQELKDS